MQAVEINTMWKLAFLFEINIFGALNFSELTSQCNWLLHYYKNFIGRKIAPLECEECKHKLQQ